MLSTNSRRTASLIDNVWSAWMFADNIVPDRATALTVIVVPAGVAFRQYRHHETIVPVGRVLDPHDTVYTPEGMSFAHTGDLWQSNSTPTSMWDWIDHVGKRYHVDVLFVNSWVMQLPRVVRGFDPELAITGHEDEVGHEIVKRKPFFMRYDRLRGLEYPSLLMMWGESYYCRPGT